MRQFVEYILLQSTSMHTCFQVTRIEKLYQTAAYFLLKVVPKRYHVGIVKFSSGASIIAPLIQMTSQRVRNDLVNRLPRYAHGSTAIGLGLLQGVKVPYTILFYAMEMYYVIKKLLLRVPASWTR